MKPYPDVAVLATTNRSLDVRRTVVTPLGGYAQRGKYEGRTHPPMHRYSTETKLKTCPTCKAEAAVIIVNVKTVGEHCHACIGPTFKPHLVYTEDDVRALRSMGIATETEAIEEFIRRVKESVPELF